jgi:hypothetical protein
VNYTALDYAIHVKRNFFFLTVVKYIRCINENVLPFPKKN